MTTDQIHDTPDTDEQEADPGTGTLPPAFTQQQVDTVLDLDAMLSSARRAERLCEVSLAGDLVRQQQVVLAELATILTPDGRLRQDPEGVDEDAGLNDDSRVARARGLEQQAEAFDREIQAGPMLRILFRALPSDEWEKFDKSHRAGSGGRIKDDQAYENEAIALSAVAPPISVEQVKTRIRKELGNAQMQKVIADAFWVNNRDGIDIPKLPSSWHAQRLLEHETS